MTFQIIIRGKHDRHCMGKTRSQQEETIRKEWSRDGGSLTDEQLDKCKWLEKKRKEHDGSTQNFILAHEIDELK